MQAKGTAPQELKRIIQERFKTGYYKAPARAGISYMLAPIMRTYDDPEKSGKVTTASHPHVMYCAPNVFDKDIGSGMLERFCKIKDVWCLPKEEHAHAEGG